MRIISTNFFKRYNPPSGKRETIRLEQETTQLLCVVTIPEWRFQTCEISQILARSNLSSAEKQIWRMTKIVSRQSWSASLCNKERSKKIWEESGLRRRCNRTLHPIATTSRTFVYHPDMESWIFSFRIKIIWKEPKNTGPHLLLDATATELRGKCNQQWIHLSCLEYKFPRMTVLGSVAWRSRLGASAADTAAQ